jgi:hypothetical protein
MNFERFAASRDFMYLAAVCMGLTLGCITDICVPRRTSRSRDALITAGLCCLSGTVAALAAALVLAGPLLTLKPLILPCGVTVCVLALAFRFPRMVAFPLLLLSGFVIVWLGYSFLRFPQAVPSALPLASVYHESGGFPVYVNASQAGASETLPRIRLRSLENEELPLEFSAGFVRYGDLYPLIGGVTRGGLSSVRQGENELASGFALKSPFLLMFYNRFPAERRLWGLSFQTCKTTLNLNAILPGLGGTVFFDGMSLQFY